VELYRRQVREGREHWDPAGMAMSRSDGEFRFAELSPGSYKLLTHELLDRDPLTFNPRGQLFGYPPSTILRRQTLQRPPLFGYRRVKPTSQKSRLQSENIIR